ncbi:MAG: B12-binding domain-containing protein [Phycisphaerales bacterium]|nr:B12-binding domain-containing protein [Phycisphaerales bacterium]
MNDQLSPKRVARAIGVSEASLKRWCDKGLISATRTAGGHRRLSRASVVEYLRSTGHPVTAPELLGLPATCGGGDGVIEHAAERVYSALMDLDDERVRRVIFDLYLAGRTMVEICDRAIATAMHEIGRAWEAGRIEVYQERRAVEVCSSVIGELRRLRAAPLPDAPLALGGALAPDPYTLASQMVELVLLEAGWRAQSLGIGHPVETLASAIGAKRPRVFWLTASSVENPEQFAADCRRLCGAAREHGAALVVGGRALSEGLRRELEYHAYCDNLRHLTSFAESLHLARKAGPTQDGGAAG